MAGTIYWGEEPLPLFHRDKIPVMLVILLHRSDMPLAKQSDPVRSPGVLGKLLITFHP